MQRCNTCNDPIPYGREGQCAPCRTGKSPEARREAREDARAVRAAERDATSVRAREADAEANAAPHPAAKAAAREEAQHPRQAPD